MNIVCGCAENSVPFLLANDDVDEMCGVLRTGVWHVVGVVSPGTQEIPVDWTESSAATPHMSSNRTISNFPHRNNASAFWRSINVRRIR